MKKTATFLAAAALLTACQSGADTLAVGEGDYVKGGFPGKADSSVEAIFVDFEFSGEVVISSTWSAASAIEDQLLYTIGHLNEDNSVGRLDQLEITNIETTPTDDGRYLATYDAKIPVAWGDRDHVPSTYKLLLPADITIAGQDSFTEKYNHDCVDFGAHDVTRGSMWYYYRPGRSGCDIDDNDIVSVDATVSISDINTTGKYPEYHKVWEDDVLQVVAVFGKYEDGATSGWDAGIRAYDRFNVAVGQALAGQDLTTVPASVPSTPGVATPEVQYFSRMADGRTVEVTTLLVDNVRTAPNSFNERYAELSAEADLIVYNGHAGLGANIRALAAKGDWQTGQYAMVFMNGCDTYAYVDSALADAHAEINADDPDGTKYLDIVTNAMPSFFHSMPNATMALVRGLMDYEDPKTYEQMFMEIDSAEVVLVSGEQDNEYFPGFDDDGGDDPGDDAWDGLEESGTVSRQEEHHYATPTLAAGRYAFTLSGSSDADLYVRSGVAPTVASWECRPYRSGSDERCEVELSSPAEVHVMVRGWASSSDYALRGESL